MNPEVKKAIKYYVDNYGPLAPDTKNSYLNYVMNNARKRARASYLYCHQVLKSKGSPELENEIKKNKTVFKLYKLWLIKRKKIILEIKS